MLILRCINSLANNNLCSISSGLRRHINSKALHKASESSPKPSLSLPNSTRYQAHLIKTLKNKDKNIKLTFKNKNQNKHHKHKK